MSFIIPSRWFSGGKGWINFVKKMLEKTDIVCITQFDDASKIFGSSVDIKGGKLFLKDNYNGDCLFNGSLSTLSKYDVFVDGKYHGIIDKLINLESITTLYKSQDYYKIQTNDKRLKPEKQMIQLNVMYLNKRI
jgi:hypothetical protein